MDRLLPFAGAAFAILVKEFKSLFERYSISYGKYLYCIKSYMYFFVFSSLVFAINAKITPYVVVLNWFFVVECKNKQNVYGVGLFGTFRQAVCKNVTIKTLKQANSTKSKDCSKKHVPTIPTIPESYPDRSDQQLTDQLDSKTR